MEIRVYKLVQIPPVSSVVWAYFQYFWLGEPLQCRAPSQSDVGVVPNYLITLSAKSNIFRKRRPPMSLNFPLFIGNTSKTTQFIIYIVMRNPIVRLHWHLYVIIKDIMRRRGGNYGTETWSGSGNNGHSTTNYSRKVAFGWKRHNGAVSVDRSGGGKCRVKRYINTSKTSVVNKYVRWTSTVIIKGVAIRAPVLSFK